LNGTATENHHNSEEGESTLFPRCFGALRNEDVFMDFLTSLVNSMPGAVAQGLIWGIMAIGVYITYRILDVADLTVDGSLGTGGAVCVVLASEGYPVKYEKGFEVKGLETFKEKDGYYVFHAGTRFDENGRLVTNGGRVLGVTATGKDLKEARKNAYEATNWIDFSNKYMRHDIGKAIDAVGEK